MTNLLSWLRALRYWLAELRYFWIAVAVTVIALVVALRPGTSEPIIRLAGLVLQMLGIGTIGWGIGETRALFGHPSFVAICRAWLNRFPSCRPRTISASINITLPAPTMNARGYGMDSAGTNLTVEARIDVLEKNLRRTNDRVDQAQRETDEEFRKMSSSVKDEEQMRSTADTTIREKLEATGTGGVHITATGALWLLVGVVLSTASPEISRWLH